MRKRITAAVLAVTMLMSGSTVLPVTFGDGASVKKVQAETTDVKKVYEGTCGASANWKLDKSSGVLTISGSGKMDDNPCDIEDRYSLTPWSTVQDEIKSVEIGDEITYIGKGSFTFCRNLTSVTIGKNVTKIGTAASEAPFYGCPLETISIGEKLKAGLSALLKSSLKEI